MRHVDARVDVPVDVPVGAPFDASISRTSGLSDLSGLKAARAAPTSCLCGVRASSTLSGETSSIELLWQLSFVCC